MTNKEKINTLVEMGFSVDEAIALASGNYRSVPDPAPDRKQDPEPDQKQDLEPDQKQDPEQQEPDRLENALQKFGKELAANIAQSIINSNIANIKQPPKQDTQDILSLMLEPKAPEMGETYGSK